MMVRVLSILSAGILICGCMYVPGTPEAAFHDFQTTPHKESYIVIPLCEASDSVVPVVTERVKEKNLDRRLYAIYFLGVSKSQLPVETLTFVANDSTEGQMIRLAAFQAVFTLDEGRGRALAARVEGESGIMADAARDLIAVTNHGEYQKDQYEEVCHPKD